MSTRGHYFHTECCFCDRKAVTSIAALALCAVHLAKVEAIQAEAAAPERERERVTERVA